LLPPCTKNQKYLVGILEIHQIRLKMSVLQKQFLIEANLRTPSK
jgi:hypothetical protein